MRRILLVSFIALMAMNSGLYAQEKDTAQTESKVKLNVVYEKTFDEPIVDVIFDTATVNIEEAKKMGWKEEAFTAEDKNRAKTLVSYPRVVLTSQGRELSWLSDARRNSYYAKELKFYDKNGRVMNKLILKGFGEEKVYLSPNHRYILVSRRPTEWNPTYHGGVLYDLDGKKICAIEGPTPIAISDEGYAVAAHLDWGVPPEPGGDFYVYDSKGKLITTIENPLKKKTAPLFAKFSKDGEYALLSFCVETYYPTIFVLITKEGRILWKKEFSEYRFSRTSGEINLSPSGIVATVYKGKGGSSILSLSWNGNLKWIKSLYSSLSMGCVFSQDAKKVYTRTLSGDVRCFSENTGNIIWKYEGKYRWTEMYEQSQYLVLKSHPSKVVFLNSTTGILKAEIEYPNQIFLAPHNEIIFVIDPTNNRIEGLKIEEE